MRHYGWLALRELYGMTQVEVAAKARVNQSYYSHIEREAGGKLGGRMLANLLNVLPIPHGLDALIIAQHLVLSPQDAPVEHIWEALSHAFPMWSVETRQALGLSLMHSLSVNAQIGFIWLVLTGGHGDPLVDWVKLSPEQVATEWRSLLARIPAPPAATSGNPVASLINAPLDRIQKAWPRLSVTHRTLLAQLAEELASIHPTTHEIP